MHCTGAADLGFFEGIFSQKTRKQCLLCCIQSVHAAVYFGSTSTSPEHISGTADRRDQLLNLVGLSR